MPPALPGRYSLPIATKLILSAAGSKRNRPGERHLVLVADIRVAGRGHHESQRRRQQSNPYLVPSCHLIPPCQEQRRRMGLNRQGEMAE